jgi:hypothetical protein
MCEWLDANEFTPELGELVLVDDETWGYEVAEFSDGSYMGSTKRFGRVKRWQRIDE